MLHSLSASLLSFALSSKINLSYIAEKSSTRKVQNPSHGNLLLLKNLQQLCCKLWPKDVCHHVITFFETTVKTNGA